MGKYRISDQNPWGLNPTQLVYGYDCLVISISLISLFTYLLELYFMILTIFYPFIGDNSVTNTKLVLLKFSNHLCEVNGGALLSTMTCVYMSVCPCLYVYGWVFVLLSV